MNLSHLRYFWVTTREGTITRASERLRLAPSTISAQIKQLEADIGCELFERSGRALRLTDHGRIAKAYADDIFALGDELSSALRAGADTRHPMRCTVGVGNDIPKLLAYRLLAPLLHLEQPVYLVVREDHPDRLVAELAGHHVDIVLSNAPMRLASEIPADSRLLATSGVTLMAAPPLAAKYRARFPGGLDDAPLLLPENGSALRRLVEEWAERAGVRPRAVGEVADSALLKAFGREGAGLFPVPSIVREEVASQYGVRSVGELDGAELRFYATTLSGRVTVPTRMLLEAAASLRGDVDRSV